jgi:hypothetical protein
MTGTIVCHHMLSCKLLFAAYPYFSAAKVHIRINWCMLNFCHVFLHACCLHALSCRPLYVAEAEFCALMAKVFTHVEHCMPWISFL